MSIVYACVRACPEAMRALMGVSLFVCARRCVCMHVHVSILYACEHFLCVSVHACLCLEYLFVPVCACMFVLTLYLSNDSHSLGE